MTDFSDANALSSLLTVESLLFAALALTGSLSAPSAGVRNLALKPKTLGYIVAGFISAVAFGALMAWTKIFLEPGSCDFRRNVIAFVLLIAIVGQPVLSWVLARGLGHKR